MKCLMLTLCMAVAVAFAIGTYTNVDAKSKVTCKLKKGTLTIKGKGEMPKKLKFKKKKVKKVVIKKGVKSISNNAFNGCKKLTKVSIPSSVKKIGINAFAKTKIKSLKIPAKTTKLGEGFINNCKKLDTVTLPGTFDIINSKGNKKSYKGSILGTDLVTVKFNSSIDYNNAAYFRTLNFVVSTKDPNFSTYDGVIYTKDGTGVVRVPSARDTVELRNGCTDFNTFAVTYFNDERETFVCNSLAKVTLPQSVVRVNNKNYPDEKYLKGDMTSYELAKRERNLSIVIGNNNLGIPEIVKLKNRFRLNLDSIVKAFPTRIVKNDDTYIGDSKYLIKAKAENKYVVPDGITTICDRAFSGNNTSEVTLPASVNTIGDDAFKYSELSKINIENVTKIGEGAFYHTPIESIELPNAITVIPDELFCDCSLLKEVKLNGKVTAVGRYSFSNIRIDLNDFLKQNPTLTTVEDHAFYYTPWSELTVPDNIKTVGVEAFRNDCYTKFFALIKGNTNGYDFDSFDNIFYTTLQFESGMNQAFTANNHYYLKSGKKMQLSMDWVKVSGASGYDIWMAKDKNLKKGVKKYTAKYSEVKKTIYITKKKAKGLKYYGIRPYKVENGKKVYGRWNINSL